MQKDGIINLLKPAGMTSHDAVSFMRRMTGIKRIGHTGTLDPMAVGVLPICIGGAARITEYLDLDTKKYRCEMKLGADTDTQDVWGTVIKDFSHGRKDFLQEKNIDECKVIKILNSFKGTLLQYPPKYSAVRVNGKRLYEYARENKEVEITPREVQIKDISLVSYNKEKGAILFDVACSKGTYIRAICQSIGELLGTGGAMSMLIRTASGVFTLDKTVTAEELSALKINDDPIFPERLEKFLFAVDYPLVYFGTVMVNDNRGKWFINGGHLSMTDVHIKKESNYKEFYSVYLENGQFLGVASFNHTYGKLVAEKVFAREII